MARSDDQSPSIASKNYLPSPKTNYLLDNLQNFGLLYRKQPDLVLFARDFYQ